jgi:lambda family phage portal protein
LTLYGLQNLATRAMFEAGDALIIMREKRTDTGLTLTLQVIDPEQLHAGAAPREAGNRVFQGVEVYPSGQIHGYHVRLRLDDSSAVFIPRRDAVHLLEILYPGQMRGIPRGAQALARAHNVDQFMSTALARAKVEACLTAFVTTDRPDDAGGLLGEPGDPDSGFLPPERLEPGLIVPLAPGEDVKVAQPPSSGGMADYVKIGLQSVAVAYGVTYDAISGDLEKVNFSSTKAGRLEFNRGIDSLRAHTIFPAVRRIIARFKEVFEANAARASDATVTLVAPGRESVEPLKDAQTLSLDLQMGVKTWAQAVRERGHDPDDQIRELADIAKKFADAGLVFKLSLGPVSIEAAAADPDDDPDADPDDPDTTA